jgi:alkylation response protein AidB-like acyl-CoA dehydrogenase
MDFNDSPEQATFRAQAYAFLSQHWELLPPGKDMNEAEFNAALVVEAKAWQAIKYDHNWACLHWPEAFGGRDATPIQSIIWTQEESRFNAPSVEVFSLGHGMIGPTLITHGTPEQKTKYLQRMARGDDIWCQLFSEPSAGSDLAGLRTSAKKDGNDWIINGQKIWTSAAQFCQYGMLVVRNDPDVVKHDGLTCFILDLASAGVDIRPIKQANGESDFNEVFFTDVRIPDENRIGAVGDGWRVTMTTLMNERVSLSGGFGMAQLFERLCAQARELGLLEDSGVRRQLADYYVRISGLEHINKRTITALSLGREPGPEGSIAKLVAAPMVQDMARFGISLQAMLGALITEDEFDFQKKYLAAPQYRIAGGTDEIMRNILAERVLRLPTEQRADKGMAFNKIPSGR